MLYRYVERDIDDSTRIFKKITLSLQSGADAGSRVPKWSLRQKFVRTV